MGSLGEDMRPCNGWNRGGKVGSSESSAQSASQKEPVFGPGVLEWDG